jgi:exonuclease III
MHKKILFIFLIVFQTNVIFSQDASATWWLRVDRDTDTKRYDKHDVITQNNQIVLDFSELAKNRTPLKVDFREDQIAKYSFSFFTRIKAKKDCAQNSVIVSNKKEYSSDGWEIRANLLGGWEWNFSSNNKIIANYKTTSKKFAINDGKFHFIGFTYDFSKNEVWIYFDGEQIGIIDVGKSNLSNFTNIFIGGVGTDEKMAFNGYFKSVYYYKEFISHRKIKMLYSKNPRYLATIGENGSFYKKIKVLTWNITDGGTTHGEIVGLNRTLKLLEQSNADIISLQESKGAVEYLSEGLGFYFYKVNDNIAILSRYPIKETLRIFDSNIVAAVEISVSKQQILYYFNVSLNNIADWGDFKNKYSDENYVSKEKETRAKDMSEILEQIKVLIKPKSKTSIILTGELNSISALDEGGNFKNFPVSKALKDYGYVDSYRELYPNSRIYNGYTRNVNSKNKRQGRVDYIFFKGDRLQISNSELLKKHPIKFPSKNYGVLTEFTWNK